jgi:hypothetical protein
MNFPRRRCGPLRLGRAIQAALDWPCAVHDELGASAATNGAITSGGELATPEVFRDQSRRFGEIVTRDDDVGFERDRRLTSRSSGRRLLDPSRTSNVTSALSNRRRLS